MLTRQCNAFAAKPDYNFTRISMEGHAKHGNKRAPPEAERARRHSTAGAEALLFFRKVTTFSYEHIIYLEACCIFLNQIMMQILMVEHDWNCAVQVLTYADNLITTKDCLTPVELGKRFLVNIRFQTLASINSKLAVLRDLKKIAKFPATDRALLSRLTLCLGEEGESA